MLYNTHTVLEQYGDCSLLVLLTIILLCFFFLYVCHFDSPLFLFLGASIYCVYNNLKRTEYLVLWFPNKTSVCTHPWQQNDFIVLTAPLNPTKLNQIISLCLVFLTFSSLLLMIFLILYSLSLKEKMLYGKSKISLWNVI